MTKLSATAAIKPSCCFCLTVQNVEQSFKINDECNLANRRGRCPQLHLTTLLENKCRIWLGEYSSCYLLQATLPAALLLGNGGLTVDRVSLH